jgi:phage protein U
MATVINKATSFLTGGAGVINYATGFIPMLILGDFMFSLNTAAFQEMQRSTDYKWASQERFGKHEALQYVGPGSDTITLPGVIYPNYRGSTAQITKLRALAAKGQPLLMIDGTGNVLGRWVIESIEEKRSNFAALGIARKQEFTIKLKHFDGGEFNVLVNAISNLAKQATNYVKALF